MYGYGSLPGNSYRRLLFALLLALALLIRPFPAAALPDPDDAESLRSFLQSTYGVTILMGDECASFSLEGFDLQIRPEAVPAFRQITDGNRRFAELLQRLWGVLSVYPPDFFSHFADRPYLAKLRFLLVDEIRRDGTQIGGVQSWHDGRNDLYIAKEGSREQALHHEIWHAMEYRILCDDPGAFDAWASLNPKGFDYTGDFSVIRSGKDAEEPDDWFALEYGKINDLEDRASVFSAFMIKEKSWWDTRPHLLKKAEFLLKKAEPVFGTLYAGE